MTPTAMQTKQSERPKPTEAQMRVLKMMDGFGGECTLHYHCAVRNTSSIGGKKIGMPSATQDLLVQRGWVRRLPGENSMRYALTDAGRAALKEAQS